MNIKTAGIGLLIGGIILCIIFLSMDTSVEVPGSYYSYGGTTEAKRVNNFGLMKDQQNLIIFSSLITVVGALMFFFGKNPVNKDEFKQCPQCAEQVKSEAKICRFCKHEFSDVKNATL